MIQRADVDNRFGEIEADLCNFLNGPYYDIKELYSRSRRLTVTGKDGTSVPGFFASPKSSVEGELIFPVSSLAVSLIKSAHLALFRLMGYD